MLTHGFDFHFRIMYKKLVHAFDFVLVQAKLSMQLEYIPPEPAKDAKTENAEDKDEEGDEEEQETGVEGVATSGYVIDQFESNQISVHSM